MKRICFFILMFTSGILCHAQKVEYQSVNAEVFEQKMNELNVVKVDVRRTDEYEKGHIEGTINIDVQKDDFLTVSERLIPKDKTIALYCQGGKRSKMAAGVLNKAGYQVVELESGYMGWVKAGKPVVK